MCTSFSDSILVSYLYLHKLNDQEKKTAEYRFQAIFFSYINIIVSRFLVANFNFFFLTHRQIISDFRIFTNKSYETFLLSPICFRSSQSRHSIIIKSKSCSKQVLSIMRAPFASPSHRCDVDRDRD